MLKWTTAGESHGQALIALVENMVAGVTVTREEVSNQLARRRLGYGRGARMKFEQDVVTFLTGMRHGKTLGSPITIMIDNTEWPKWETIMSADPISLDNPDVAAEMDSGRGARLTRPRPGHADLSGMLKYGHSEARPVLERASARETAARVAAGTVAREFLRQVAGIEILSHVVSIGQSAPYSGPSPEIGDLSAIDDSPVRAFSPEAEQDMIGRIEAAKKSGDTLGGVFEVIATNVPIGLGSFTSAQGRLDAKIAAALMSIQAIKGVEIGDGFDESRRPGSEAHDEIYAQEQGFSRSTNRAGGLEGGMSNGEPIRVRAAMKPISTVPRALSTVNMDSGESATAIHQRSDVCAVPAAAIVGESMLALTLAEVFLEKFGGDSLPETASNYRNYCATITQRLQWDQEH